MSSQPSLITVASPATVQKPSNLQQWQLFRNTAIPGIGEYFAMNKNGVIEPIGGGAFPEIPHVHITFDSITKTLTANVSQGTAPFTYLWRASGGNYQPEISTKLISGNAALPIFGSPTAQVTTIAFPVNFKETYCNIILDITDANGLKTETNFLLHDKKVGELEATIEFSDIDAQCLVIGGVEPYSYAWGENSLVTDITFTGLIAGVDPINFNIKGSVGSIVENVATLVGPPGLNFYSLWCVVTDANNSKISVSGSALVFFPVG